jgi:hypothetical protein
MDEYVYKCAACDEHVVPGQPGVVRATPFVTVPANIVGHERLRDVPVLFHEHCFPYGSPEYEIISE